VSVEITIDELLLRGIAPERAHDVQRAIEARLARLEWPIDDVRAAIATAVREALR
jgi:hypothetical protein